MNMPMHAANITSIVTARRSPRPSPSDLDIEPVDASSSYAGLSNISWADVRVRSELSDHMGMARQRDLSVLAHGVRYWNQNARALGIGRPDLANGSFVRARLDNIAFRGADLSGADLRFAKLRGADLTDAILDNADLSDAVLDGAQVRAASIKKARLHRTRAIAATFEDAEFSDSDLIDTNFNASNLAKAIFLHSNIDKANFTSADASGAVFYFCQMTEVLLRDCNFSGAYFGGTTLNDVDLSVANGLDEISHRAASFVSFGTMRLNPTPQVLSFLAACGLNAIEIVFGRVWRNDISADELIDIGYDLVRLRAAKAIMINPLFISYSHADRSFVDKLELAFRNIGIRCWRDVKDMTVGPVDTQIDRAMRMNPTVLLVLSKSSVRSDWVEWEAAAARRIEREVGGLVLCPITLDEQWKTCEWPGPLRHQIESYHLLDFSGWIDERLFQRQFDRLCEGLRVYYNNSSR